MLKQNSYLQILSIMAMKECPKCGSTDIDIGGLVEGGPGHSTDLWLTYISDKSGFFGKTCKTKVYMCLKCRYIETYADEKKFEKFKEKLSK